MGYYTNYRLEAEPWPDGLSQLIESDEFDWLTSAVEPDGSSRDSCSWYDHEVDMREVSKRFPGLVLTLSGEGEETGDAWIKHFRDGKMQVRKAELVYPEYDPDGFR